MSMKQFQIISELGTGAYSTVYKVLRLKDKQIYALKKVKLQSLTHKQQLNTLNEIRILASIKHPNIISYKDAFLDQETQSLCLVTEFADDGDLEQKIGGFKENGKRFYEEEVWSFFNQIGKGLKALHSNNIIHRDLKSANIFLFKNGAYKLGDMNVSTIIRNKLCMTQTGTPYYASPQIWKDQPYSSKSDVWSLGVIVYQMCTLNPPFMSESMEGLYKKVIKGIYPKINNQIYSKSLRNVIRQVLQVKQIYRPTIQQILASPRVKFSNADNEETQVQDEITLLKTIKIPSKTSEFKNVLPKPKYTMKKKKMSLKVIPSFENTLKPISINRHISPKYTSQTTILPPISKKSILTEIKY